MMTGSLMKFATLFLAVIPPFDEVSTRAIDRGV